MTTTTSTTFRIEAAYDASGKPTFFAANFYFASYDDAVQFADSMPKMLRARSCHLTGDTTHRGIVNVRANFTADAANGGKNESGIRRYRRLMQWLSDNGHAVEWRGTWLNAYKTQADFESAIV